MSSEARARDMRPEAKARDARTDPGRERKGRAKFVGIGA